LVGGLGTSLLGQLALAGETRRHNFLFVFAAGGWDPTYCFASKAGVSGIDTQSGAGVSSSGELSWVSHDDRPSVDDFFATWGDRCAIVNGMEVRSITHERCRRLLLTGRVDSGADDWGATLAHGSDTLLPYLVASGPAFTSQYTASVVRLGPAGQLVELLDGSCFSRSDAGLVAPGATVQELEGAFAAARVERFAATAGAGFERRWAEGYQQAIEQLDTVTTRADDLDLEIQTGGYVTLHARIKPALTCFEEGLSRCAMVQHDGLWDVGWDTHSGIDAQSEHFEDLFQNLGDLLDDLDTRFVDGASLLDQTTVVVVSEMGRTPGINGTGGKDHWTYTSAMLVGAGVAGGRVVGAFDDDLLGEGVDLASGETSDKGRALTSGVLGATLLAMGDRDPGDTDPLTAIMA